MNPESDLLQAAWSADTGFYVQHCSRQQARPVEPEDLLHMRYILMRQGASTARL